MPHVTCTKSVAIVRTPRVKQLEGMFDVPPVERSEKLWDVVLPLEERDWQIGLIVGPSGCGKSTLAAELFPEALVGGFDWPADKSIVDAFPAAMGIKDVVGLLSSVGFSSPPNWLRPFRVLSNGEQFRVTIARALAEKPDLAVIDEFTSVVDRTVARIGSAAIATAVRREEASHALANDTAGLASSRLIKSQRRFVAVSCHYDIIDWLDPDWTYDPAANDFRWRSLRRDEPAAANANEPRRAGLFTARPEITLQITRVHRSAWQLFKPHHYLSGDLSKSARCFVACVVEEGDDRNCLSPAAFTAVIHRPDSHGGYWSEHRTVCLPDFQGVGIGNALSEFVAAIFVATGKRYCSTTSHPAMIRHRARSKLWTMHRPVSFSGKHSGPCAAFNRSAALHRLTAGFRFVGEPNGDAARGFGITGGECRMSNAESRGAGKEARMTKSK